MARTLLYMFVVSAEATAIWYEGPNLANTMRDRIAAYGRIIGQLRGLITDPAEVVYRPLIKIPVNRPWHRCQVLLAGDAVHRWREVLWAHAA